MVRQAAPRPSWSEPPLGRDPAASRESISANLNTELEGGGTGSPVLKSTHARRVLDLRRQAGVTRVCC